MTRTRPSGEAPPGEAPPADRPPRAIDVFLDSVTEGGGIPGGIYAPGAVLDATVPNWRFHRHSPAAITAEYAALFAHRAELEELCRWPAGGAEVVRYLLTWNESDVPHAAHHCHVLALDPDGRTASDTVFCCGRLAGLLADMAAAEKAP